MHPSRPPDRPADDDRRTWLVLWHLAAVEELNQIKEMKLRKAVISVAEILRQRGPQLLGPHSKKVRGEDKLRELRPSGGRALVRPLYVRIDDVTFVILALGPEAVTDPRGFDVARTRARERALADFGIRV